MIPISTVAARLKALAGWHRRLALVALGALAALALPPVGLVPVLLLSLPALVWMLDAAPNRRAAFGTGWWWGFGWCSAGFYWIANALLTDPARFGWMIPFAIFGLSGLVAVFIGLPTLAARMAPVRGPGRILILAAAWTIGEWLRSWVLTGFPWNPLGSVWDVSAPMLQFGAVAGVWGLGLLTAVMFSAPALLTGPLDRRTRLLVAAATIGLPLAGWAGGSLRLALAPAPTAPESLTPGVTLRLVQASLSQAGKWRDDLREANLMEQVALSRRPGFERLTAVIWPETAASYFLDLDGGHRRMAAGAAPEGGLLLTGAPRATPRNVEPFQVWNSLFAVTPEGEVVASYDKAHLVPFGEYVPMRAILPIRKITHGGTDFSPGPGPRTLDVPGLPALGPMICYEDIFPAAVIDPAAPRPRWLMTITNDGWFGISAGPYQHLAAARMRAIEEGLPLVRSANTGVSAVFDSYGREIARLGLGEKGILDSPLPLPLDPTPYARFGNATVFILVLLALHLGTRRFLRNQAQDP